MRRAGKLLRRVLPSMLTFMAGVGAMFIADILISRLPDASRVAEWAALKSFMMVAGVGALFGMEQLLVREPKAVGLILRVSFFHVMIVALIAGLAGAALGLVATPWLGAAVVVGFAASSLSFQWLRSSLRVTASYVANSTWRILFLIGVITLVLTGHAPVGHVLVGAFLIGFCVIAALIIRRPAQRELHSPHDDLRRIFDVYAVGGLYFVSALSLAIAAYGENLVVNQLGTDEDLANYFRAAVVFLFPGVMLNQYLGAMIGPAIRQNEGKALGLLRRHGLKLILLVAVLVPGLVVGGYLLEAMFYPQISANTPLILAVMLSLTACIRLVYVLPSAFIGTMATRKELVGTTFAYLGCSLLLPILAFVFTENGMVVTLAVALANLINWSLRCLVGAGLVRRRFLRHAALTASNTTDQQDES